MKKTVFTIGAVLLITSGFVSESFGKGSSSESPPAGGGTPSGGAGGTGIAPAKLTGNAQNFQEKQSELKAVPELAEQWAAIQNSPKGICTGNISHKKPDEILRAAKCATEPDEPSMFLKLIEATKKSPGDKKVLCALVANSPERFYRSLTSKFTLTGAKDTKANAQISLAVSACYKKYFATSSGSVKH